MKIEIIKIADEKKKKILFSTKYGLCCGIWSDTTYSSIYELNSGNEYYVEFDLEEVLVWGKSIKVSNSDEIAFEISSTKVCIKAELETVDDDLVATVKMGNSIFLVETEGVPQIRKGYVEINASTIYLFDIGI